MKEKNNADNKEKSENLSDSDKRKSLTIWLTPEEKLVVTKEAVTVCGISVSEYVRTKIFAPSREPNKDGAHDTFDDAERKIFEDRIESDASLIKTLQEKLVKATTPGAIKETELLKEELAELKEQLEKQKGAVLISESDVLLKLTSEERKIVDMAVDQTEQGSLKKVLLYFCLRNDLVEKYEEDFPKEYRTKGTPEYVFLNEFLQRLKEGKENEVFTRPEITEEKSEE